MQRKDFFFAVDGTPYFLLSSPASVIFFFLVPAVTPHINLVII